MSENYIIKIPKKHLIFYCCQTPGQKKVLICLPSMTALGTETRGILISRVFVFQQIPVPVSVSVKVFGSTDQRALIFTKDKNSLQLKICQPVVTQMNKSYFKRELLFFLLAPGFIFAVAGYNKKASVQLFKQIFNNIPPSSLKKFIHLFTRIC